MIQHTTMRTIKILKYLEKLCNDRLKIDLWPMHRQQRKCPTRRQNNHGLLRQKNRYIPVKNRYTKQRDILKLNAHILEYVPNFLSHIPLHREESD